LWSLESAPFRFQRRAGRAREDLEAAGDSDPTPSTRLLHPLSGHPRDLKEKKVQGWWSGSRDKSACLASVRFRVQTPVLPNPPPKKKKNLKQEDGSDLARLGAEATGRKHDFQVSCPSQAQALKPSRTPSCSVKALLQTTSWVLVYTGPSQKGHLPAQSGNQQYLLS
jgi:hypothetical protein